MSFGDERRIGLVFGGSTMPNARPILREELLH